MAVVKRMIWIFAGCVVVFVLGLLAQTLSTSEARGAAGERRLSRRLSKIPGLIVLNDITLPFGQGTSQVDHIILSPFGVFVLESKTMSGVIEAYEDTQEWNQHLGGRVYPMYNPLKQNETHVRSVAKALNLSERDIKNFVVFLGSARPEKGVRGVFWSLVDVENYFRSDKHKKVYNFDQLVEMRDRLDKVKIVTTRRMKKEHIAYAKKTAHEKKIKIESGRKAGPCPCCHGPMIERVNRKSGQVFFGCLSFPKCKGTRKDFVKTA